MTRRKASVQRAKREAYFRAGTCSQCRVAIVWNARGLCRRCLPVAQDREELEAEEALEAEKATLHFRYYLTVRKKDATNIGMLARAYLTDRSLRELRGLDAIAAGTSAEQVDVKVLEAAWQESEDDRARLAEPV